MKYKTQKISMKLFLISMAIVFVSGVVLAGCGKKKDLAALASPTLSDSKEFGEAKDVAIFYEDDPTQDWNYGKLYAIMVRNLLGHFNTNVSFINVDDYHRKELDDFDAAIYISTIDDYPLNDYFLGNVYSAKKPFMWINWNISQFFEREDWPAEEHFGFDFKGVELVGSYSSYIYKDKKLPSTEEDSSFYLNKIDVGAKSEIHDLIRSMAKKGKVVIVISSELPETLALCDRIMVMWQGEKTGELFHDDATEGKLMHLSAGLKVNSNKNI